MTKLKWTALGLLLVLVGGWSAVAQQPTNPGLTLASGQLVTHFQEQTNGPTVFTVVDPQTHVVAVYHIAREDGKIKFMSMRNFALDLRMAEYNNDGLKPEDIRKMLELRQ